MASRSLTKATKTACLQAHNKIRGYSASHMQRWMENYQVASIVKYLKNMFPACLTLKSSSSRPRLLLSHSSDREKAPSSTTDFSH